ncbi:MAG: CRISPR-associated protein [Hydrocarboniphaga sp.]|uniref:type I-G CRISPR-associated protein Cas7 n=1 Tax=Hydrocarboniphaga sp. TaxID=2033016 RepID=UPI0026020056|nr:type I-U CRISPR-associated protein Cas7 [Hydrocarboniphaga sp.]MDB5967572.1 CRISPR-associated protein [Hydrocarboniphaga sp.]
MSNNTSTGISLLEFDDFTVPAGCRRIFITAELEPSNGDPRIQPTGFPDIGPVMYPDPSGQHGLICLVESEASMANRLEDVCLSDKYTGALKPALGGLPYIKLTENGEANGVFKTSSSIDGHRFASEYIMGAKGRVDGIGSSAEMKSFQAPANQNREMVELVKARLGMPAGDTCPAANVPEIFRLAMEYDPLSLIHGFQISVKNKLTFVGLRSPRALTASIVGLNCERVSVPGIRFDPIGTGDAGQAIFQKQRITAKTIEARFSIDVGLLASLRLDTPQNGIPGQRQNARFQLLLAIALWKVAVFLDLLRIELSLRSECKLRLKDKAQPQFKAEGGSPTASGDFPYSSIANGSLTREGGLIAGAQLPAGRHPLVLAFA